MGNKIGYALVATLLCFFISCNGLIESGDDLGGGYVYQADGGMMWIGGDNVYRDGVPGNVVDLSYDSLYIIAAQKPSKNYYHYFFAAELTSRYSLLLYNSDLKENPDEFHKRFMQSKWWMDTILKSKITKYISADNFNDTEKIAQVVDSVVNNDPFYKEMFMADLNYWIVVKEGNLVLGPLSRKNYLLKRKELFISDELQLNDE